MSEKIEYINPLGIIITANKARSLNRYSVVKYENGIIKTIIYIKKEKGIEEKGIWYYMDSSEVKSEVLQNLKQLKYYYFILFFNKTSAFGVDLWDYEEYGIDFFLKAKGKSAYDSKHRQILSCSLDFQTNLPKGQMLTKSYYRNNGNNESEDKLVEVEYLENGNVNSIFDYNENFGYSEPISLQEFLTDTKFSQQDFPWTQHPYYHSIYPFLPEGPL